VQCIHWARCLRTLSTRDPPSVYAIDRTNHKSCLKRQPQEGMRDTTMVSEALDRPAQAPKRVDVRKLGSHGHGDCGICCTPIQAASRQARAGKNVGDRLHSLAERYRVAAVW